MEQYAKEILRRALKPRQYAGVVTQGIDDVWGLDLGDMSAWAADNDGYKYIFVAIDCFSRYAWPVPLKTKTTEATWAALELALETARPKQVWVDRGTEFYNALWTRAILPDWA